MFSAGDRKILEEIRTEIKALRSEMPITALLVEILNEVKAAREEFGGMSPGEIAAVTEKLNKAGERLSGISHNEPPK